MTMYKLDFSKEIQVRLTVIICLAVELQEIKNWTQLKNALKSSLEPQGITIYLFSESYSSRQKIGEEITKYAYRFEQLQTLIREHVSWSKPSKYSWIDSDFWKTSKAKIPLTLDKAIQAAREEERVRNSQEATKK